MRKSHRSANAPRQPAYHPRPHRAVAALLLLGSCTLAMAQADYKPDTALPTVAMRPDPLRPMPTKVQHDNGVTWVTGGVGLLERQRTIEAGRDMNLELSFARMPEGVYLAGVDVAITDGRGREVLTVDNADPLLFVQLPAGTYQVEASFDGSSIERRVKVPASGQHTELIHWRADTATRSQAR